MKRPRVKKRLPRKIKFCVFLLASGLVFTEIFLNPGTGEPSPNSPVITSSLNNFTETVLEKSFETLQFIWSKLKGLPGDHAGESFNSFLSAIRHQPLMLAGVVLLISGLLFAIFRYRKTQAERKQMLEDLKKSIEDDDYEEEEQPLFLDPGATEEDLDDDDARPLFPDETAGEEKALTAESNGSFVADSTLTVDPYEPDHTSITDHGEEDILTVLEKEPAEDTFPPEKKPAVDAPREATEDDEILKKLEEEFIRLENEFQDVDTLREEVAEQTPDKKDLSKIASPMDREQGPDSGSDEFYPLSVIEKEVLGNEKIAATEPEEDEDMEQSLADFQEEMEQTIQELSEQLANGDDETLFGNSPMEEPIEAEGLTAKQESSTTTAGNDSPVVDDHEQVKEVLPPGLPPQEKATTQAPLATSPQIDESASIKPEAIAQTGETRSEEVAADPAMDDRQRTVARKPEPATEKPPPIDPEKAHRQINHLVSFQKNLEERLQKMRIPQPPAEEADAVSPKEPSGGLTLQPAEENYEQSKLSLKKKNSFDLLESFILLDSQKKYD